MRVGLWWIGKGGLCLPFIFSIFSIVTLASCGGEDSPLGPDLPDGQVSTAERNVEARANAFRLYYRERVERVLLSYNRFAAVADSVAAATINKQAIARSGNTFEVVPGPNDNNSIGQAAFDAYHAYKTLGGRPLALTCIRLFEGLTFIEGVSGHPGLTCREALPGWTLTMDGVNGTVSRVRDGAPVASPVPTPPGLEQEILSTFYDGVVITYRADPSEYYFTFKPVNELEAFAITFVFSGLPDFLRISNCCSSWMKSQVGHWAGGFWGNHNSRDNFPDLALGYLAARECAADPNADEDLRLAAQRAAEAGARIGDSIMAHGGALMTVDEHHDYDVLEPSGQVRPDGTTEWQDLGSMASCQMAYLAQALSTEGLSWPPPPVPLPGALETMFLYELMHDLGFCFPLPVRNCDCIDDAYLGKTWGEALEMEILGFPWYKVADFISQLDPDLFPELLGGMMDDFKEMELAVVAIGYYAQISGKPEVYESAIESLANLIGLQRILACLVYDVLDDPELSQAMVEASARGGKADPLESLRSGGEEMLYLAVVFSRMFGLDAPDEDLLGFAPAESQNDWIESQLYRGDTSPWPLLSDEEIRSRIEAGLEHKEPWIQERYHERFGETGPPVRRAGEGYEAIGPDGEWGPAENPRHEWFGGFKLFFELPLCTFDPSTLDCTWAAMGCVRADLDGSGAADGDDLAIFQAAWEQYGPGATCSEADDWCGGADLDRSGLLDEEDPAFMDAAQGCSVY